MPVSRRMAIFAPLVIVGVAASAVPAMRLSRNADPPQEITQPQPRAVIDRPEFDVGAIELSEELNHKFVIRNAGDAPLEIWRGVKTCTCTVTKIPSKPIPPGGRAEFDISFKLDGKVGPLSRIAYVATNDPDRESIMVKIVGLVRGRLVISPDRVRATLQVADQDRTAEAFVYSQIWNQFQLRVAETSLKGMTCRFEAASQADLNRFDARCGYRVVTSFPLDMPDGRFAEWVDLTGRPSDSSEEPTPLHLEIQGTLDGRLTMHGAKIEAGQVLRLGSLSAGKATRESIVLKVHDPRRALVIHRIESRPEFLRARVTPLDTAARLGLYRMEVEIPGDAPSCSFLGDQAGIIAITTDHPQLPRIELKVDFAVVGDSSPHRVAVH